MKKTILFLLFLFAVLVNANSQNQKPAIPASAKVVGHATKSPEYTAVLSGVIKPTSLDTKWQPMLSNICIKHHSEIDDEALKTIKAQKQLLRNNAAAKSAGEQHTDGGKAATPVVNANFSGNTNTGNSPLDNSVAISNGGNIVSVANNSIQFYSTGGSLTFTNTIDGFFNDATINNVCDPVILYDSGADRFIFFAQECSGASSNSNILLCFSQTNDPNGSWWNYKLTGHPSGSNTWFDYPKMAVSNNELYVCGNSFNNSGTFQEALLFQINKNNGYAGASLSWQYWHNIAGNPFTLLPVSFGQQGNYGPGCYLVATHAGGGSTVELYDLTDDMTATNETINHFTISTTAYSPAGDAAQAGTSRLLDNGDCRALSGFYLDGILHFVFHSDFTNGFNGINYNRINLAAQTNTSSTFGQTGFDYSYPSVASFATTTNNKSVMIGFGRSSNSIFPEVRVVNCDDGMWWGPSVLVKSGEGFSDYTASGSNSERWGDYTGTSRKHNNGAATVWMNGMYGTTSNDWSTWIAEITGTGSTIGIENIGAATNQMKVSPNPVLQEFKTEFTLNDNAKISIDVYDVAGKLVKKLFEGNANAGKNQFTFNKANLGSGVYFITISSNNQTLKNEKIIIAD